MGCCTSEWWGWWVWNIGVIIISKGKSKYPKRNLLHYHFFDHKSQIDLNPLLCSEANRPKWWGGTWSILITPASIWIQKKIIFLLSLDFILSFCCDILRRFSSGGVAAAIYTCIRDTLTSNPGRGAGCYSWGLLSRVKSLFFNWAPRHEGVLGEWIYSSTHSLTSALDGGEWSASRLGPFTPMERAPGTNWIGGWVGPRAVLDAVVKRKIRSSHRESNSRTPIVQPIAQRYTDWAITSRFVVPGAPENLTVFEI
jgi:hypothetical protein